MRLPVRILLWVVAFVIGALIVRFFAKVTGFAGGDTFFDLLIDGSVGTYLRLFALVPIWALFATLIATVFIDGPGWWARRMGTASARPTATRVPKAPPRPKASPPAAPSAGTADRGRAAAVGAAAAGATTRTIPRRQRPDASATPGPAPARTRTAASAPVPAPADRTEVAPLAPVGAEPGDEPADFAARAQAGQRPRRIPRRGDGA